MTTLQPRAPYSREELRVLYPRDLELRQVQIILRHGERTPVNARFNNAGLAAFWPYCSAAKALRTAVLEADGSWGTLEWTRRLESFEQGDIPKWNTGSNGEVDGICQPGELTDRGRETTLALGQRIRKLYVDQLGFLPSMFDSQTASQVHVRATPIPRALESVQQAFNGLYPSSRRLESTPPPIIVTRAMQDETLFPNEGACKRFGELARAFADRTAQLYNDGPELRYINKKIGKYMPAESPVVKVDSHPRLSGIMDSVNATLAHGKDTRLPSEFYDKKVLQYIDRICVEEWFVGYEESNEYRKLGIGSLISDLTQRMVEKTASSSMDGRDGGPFKISLAGCHDTTIAASLAALGALNVDKDKWPKFTSSIAFELFQRKNSSTAAPGTKSVGAIWPSREKTWWYSLFSSPRPSQPTSARTPLTEWSENEKRTLDDYYVRLRYNDKPVTIPFCKPSGRHFEHDETFCTLAAFKEAADSVTPRHWKEECSMNLGKSPVGGGIGGIEKPPGL
jgi:acid phosphatase